jgi:hypothetical protein
MRLSYDISEFYPELFSIFNKLSIYALSQYHELINQVAICSAEKRSDYEHALTQAKGCKKPRIKNASTKDMHESKKCLGPPDLSAAVLARAW